MEADETRGFTHTMLIKLLDTLTGCFWLAILWLRTVPLGRRAYWDWRWQTAFGRGVPPKGQMLLALLRYAQWTARMRRLR